jgi:hypothetical protein
VTAPPGRAHQVSRGTRTVGGVQNEAARRGGPRRLYQISLRVRPDATRRSRDGLLGRLIPDQNTISDFPKNNGVTLRKVCASFDALCSEIGLLTQASGAINGSKFNAVNASRDT